MRFFNGARLADAEIAPFGLLVLDKPTGITSHTAVRRVARQLGVQRAGHAGTLDPLASGILLVGLGRATRLLEYLVGHDKAYRARIRLGESSDTLDREGRILETRPVPALTSSDVEEALSRFRGRVVQVPPVHSAIKVGGQPLYRRVRRGEDVAAPPRTVEISRLELLTWDSPDLVVELSCSSGTYVRSLARDLGEALGTGATLWDLVRVRSGPFELKDAVPLDTVETEGVNGWSRVIEPEQMIRGLVSLVVGDPEARALATGRALPGREVEEGADVAIFNEQGQLVAIARPDGVELRPVKVFRPAD